MTTGMEASVTTLWWTSIWMCRATGVFSSSHLDYLHCAHFSEICQDTVRSEGMRRTLHLPLLWPLFLVFRSTGDIENPRIPRGALHSIDMWWRGNRWQPRWCATSAHNYSISRIGVVDDTCLTWLGYFRCVNVLLCSDSLFSSAEVGGGPAWSQMVLILSSISLCCEVYQRSTSQDVVYPLTFGRVLGSRLLEEQLFVLELAPTASL